MPQFPHGTLLDENLFAYNDSIHRDREAAFCLPTERVNGVFCPQFRSTSQSGNDEQNNTGIHKQSCSVE